MMLIRRAVAVALLLALRPGVSHSQSFIVTSADLPAAPSVSRSDSMLCVQGSVTVRCGVAGTLGQMLRQDVVMALGYRPTSPINTASALSGNISGALTTTQGDAVAHSIADRFAKHLDIEDFAAHADGVTDDTTVLQEALNLAASSGRYELSLGPHSYLIDRDDLVIPPGVSLSCTGSFLGERFPTQDWRTAPCTLIINPAHTVGVGAHATMEGVNVIRKGLMPPTSMRTAVQMIAAFAGTGIVIQGIDAHVSRGMILGFSTCISNNGFERNYVDRVFGDCTSGSYQNGSHDISRISNTEFWPYTIGHVTWSNNGRYVLTGLSSNGTGMVRAAFAPGGEPPVTDDLLQFGSLSGVPLSMRGPHRVTVIDSTHMDLQGVSWPLAVATGVTITSGSVTAMAGDTSTMGPGMAITGNGISTRTTIASVVGTSITLSVPATASGLVLATITPATVSAGYGYIDLTARSGRGFSWTNGENNTCDHCFDFGHEISYYIGLGAGWTSLTASSADHLEDDNPNSIGLLFDVGSYDSMVLGGFFSGHGHEVLITGSGDFPAHKFSAVSFNVASASPVIGLLEGQAIFSGCTIATYTPLGPNAASSIYVGDNVGTIIMTGNNFGKTPLIAQTAAAASRVLQSANIMGGP